MQNMFLDVADLPASLTRWDSKQMSHKDLLRVPSYDEICIWSGKNTVPFIDDDDETSVLSLGSAPSDASTRVNSIDLGMILDSEFTEETTDMQQPTVQQHVATQPRAQVPIGGLNLKLDTAEVAAAWSSMAGSSRPVFTMPHNELTAAAAAIPSAAALAASIAPADLPVVPATVRNTNNNIATAFVSGRRPPGINVQINNSNTKWLTAPGKSTVSSLKSGSKKSSCKRPRVGKSSDKRPRIKGRFVKREELEKLRAEQTRSDIFAGCRVPEDDMLLSCSSF